MRISKWVPISGILTLMLLITACYSEDGRKYGKSPDHSNYGSPLDSNSKAESERAYQTQQLYGAVTHNNKSLEYNKTLSDYVANLNGVNTAIVMTTDQNAYVAILIDNTAHGTKGTIRETNNHGTNVGIYDTNAANNDSAQPNQLHSGANNYETAKHHDLLSHRFKQTIAEQIRKLQPAVMDVYISANRDFVNQMNRYAIESWKGNSLQGYLPEFNKSVEQVFGNAQVLPDHSPDD